MIVRNVPNKIFSIKGTTVIKADDDLIVTVTAMKNGAYTIASQPLLPSRITLTHAAASTVDTLGIVTIVGKFNGANITEVLTPTNGETVTSVNYFDTITSITGSGWTAQAVADNIKIGVGAVAKIPVMGRAITFYNVSGNLWLNPLDVATADSASFPMIAAGSIDLVAQDYLYVITDATGGSLKYIIWDLT